MSESDSLIDRSGKPIKRLRASLSEASRSSDGTHKKRRAASLFAALFTGLLVVSAQ